MTPPRVNQQYMHVMNAFTTTEEESPAKQLSNAVALAAAAAVTAPVALSDGLTAAGVLTWILITALAVLIVAGIHRVVPA